MHRREYNGWRKHIHSSGTYTDILVSSLGCDSMITTELTVEPLSAIISQSNNMLNATTLSGNAPFTYLWNTGETSQSILQT